LTFIAEIYVKIIAKIDTLTIVVTGCAIILRDFRYILSKYFNSFLYKICI
jgi:hypothetical protein